MTVEFYMDTDFDHEHERRAFARLRADLERLLGNRPELYLVLANYRRKAQIDLTVLKRDAVIVIELKEEHRPFRATENGPWRTIVSGGQVGRSSENALAQVSRSRENWADLLRDVRRTFLSPQRAAAQTNTMGQVSAMVAISPALPAGTENLVPDSGWFKLVGLDTLAGTIAGWRAAQNPNFSEAELRKLVELLNIQRADPVLAAAEPSPDAPAETTYNPFFEPPPVVESLEGRTAEQAALSTALLEKPVRLINLRGPEGIGRTELAGWLGTQFAQNSWRILWVSARQQDVSVDSFLAAIAAEIPTAPEHSSLTDSQSAWFDRGPAALPYLDRPRTLVVFDDFEAVQNPLRFGALVSMLARRAKYVRFLTISLGRPAVLSDINLNPATVREVELAGLPVELAPALLGPAVANQLTAAQIGTVWRETEGNPLMARVLAQALLSKAAGGAHLLPTDMQARLQWALKPLSAKARVLAEKLAVLQTKLTPRLIRQLARPEHRLSDELTRELVALHVLQPLEDTQNWLMPALLRGVLLRTASDTVTRSAHASAGSHFRERADKALEGAEQLSYLRLSLYHLAEAQKWRDVLGLAERAHPLLVAQGDVGGAWRVAQAAAEAADQVGVRLAALRWWTQALQHAVDLEQPERAEQTLPSITKHLTHHENTAETKAARQQALMQVGRWHYRQQALPPAAEAFGEALELASMLADDQAIADSHIRLGQTLRRLGNYSQAKVHLQAALESAKRLDRPDIQFEALNYLGTIARRLGYVAEASGHYLEAYQIARATGNPRQMEETSSYLGRLAAHPAVNDVKRAERYARQALKLAEKQHNQRGVRIEVTRLIDVLLKAGKYEEAERLLARSQEINTQANDKIGLAWDALYLGRLLKHAGRTAAGNASIRKGLESLRNMGIADDEWRADFEAALMQ